MYTTDKKNIKFGIVLSYVSMGISILGTLFITNRVLNYLGDHNYGLYSFVGSITAWLTVVSSALNASFLRFSSIEASENGRRTGVTNGVYFKLCTILGSAVLLIGLSVVGILSFCNICIGHYDLEESKLLYSLFALSIINISISTSFTVFTLYVVYRGKFIFEKTIKIAVTVLNYVGHFFIAFYTRNILLISAYTIFITLFSVVLNWRFAKKRLEMEFEMHPLRDNSKLIRQIAFFSSVLVINSVIDQVNSNVDKTLLGFFSTPENITIYHMGMQFCSYLEIMVISISSVFAPTINQLVINKEIEETNHLFLRISEIQALVVCCIAFGFVACGKDFMTLWIGSKRIYSYYVGATLMLISIMPLSVKTSVDIQRAMNKHYFRSAVYFAVALLNVILSIIFLIVFPDDYAIFACLLGSVIASVLTQWLAMNVYNSKVIKLPIKAFLKSLLSYMLFGAACAAVVTIVRKVILDVVSSGILKLGLEILLFMILYISFLLIFKRQTLFSAYKALRKA